MADPIQAILVGINQDIRQVEVLSHNLANANTPGFVSKQVFSQYIEGKNTPELVVRSHVVTSEIKNTGRLLDIAVLDLAFFVLEQQGNQYLTRNGRFYLSANNVLQHSSGAELQGQNGSISLPEGQIRIDNRGQVFVDEQLVDRLLMVTVADKAQLQSIGKGMHEYPESAVVAQANLQQGAINNAQASTASDMVRLIELSRHAQSLQKALHAVDQVSNAGINELGKR